MGVSRSGQGSASQWDVLQAWQSRRRQGAQSAMDRNDTLRTAMINNIASTTSNAVQLSEMMLRSKSRVNKKA